MDLSAFGSNVLGALTVAGMAGIAYCVKNKMKHNECDLNMPCLKIRSHEDDETRNTIRQEVLDELRKDGLLRSPPRIVTPVPTPAPTPPVKRPRDIEEGEASPPLPVIEMDSPVLLSVPAFSLGPPRKRARTGNRL